MKATQGQLTLMNDIVSKIKLTVSSNHKYFVSNRYEAIIKVKATQGQLTLMNDIVSKMKLTVSFNHNILFPTGMRLLSR